MNLEAEFERLKTCSRILIWGGGYHTKEATLIPLKSHNRIKRQTPKKRQQKNCP